MMKKFFAAGILAGLLLQMTAVTPALAVNTTDYLIQMVCANNSTNVAQNGDPVSCPSGTTARKLMVGEALPYHKVDLGGYQYSDSFPINDANGVSLGVQTYVFTDEIPTFGDKFNAAHGGYNIIGADSNYVFFRGTFDPSGGWQPWWTSSCAAKGWLLFPNTTAPLSYGGTASPTTNQPDCVTSTTNTVAATVEWDSDSVTYAAGQTLDSLIVFAYAPSYGAIEVNYFTKEYGVTRWEAWKLGTGTTPAGTQAQCPNWTYSISLHGNNYYMYDCRDWSTLVQLGSPWQPTAVNSTTHEATWPVDPLYTSVNLLKNTHIGGAYAANGGTSCATTSWNRTSTTNLSWAWDTTSGTPFYTPAGNCLLGFSSSTAGQSIYQTVSAGSGSSSFSYGTMLWSPSYYWVDEVEVPGYETTSYYLLNDEVDTSTIMYDPYPDEWAYDLTGTIRGMYMGGGPGPSGNESYYWVSNGPPRWVPGYTIPAHYSLSSAPTADIKVVQRNGSGVVTATKTMTVTLDATPRVFSDTFTLASTTQTVTFSIEPKANYVQYRFTGAWVARQ
jgi:hypothetical protein